VLNAKISQSPANLVVVVSAQNHEEVGTVKLHHSTQTELQLYSPFPVSTYHRLWSTSK
jgi:hypothetical protein